MPVHTDPLFPRPETNREDQLLKRENIKVQRSAAPPKVSTPPDGVNAPAAMHIPWPKPMEDTLSRSLQGVFAVCVYVYVKVCVCVCPSLHDPNVRLGVHQAQLPPLRIHLPRLLLSRPTPTATTRRSLGVSSLRLPPPRSLRLPTPRALAHGVLRPGMRPQLSVQCGPCAKTCLKPCLYIAWAHAACL